MTVIHPENLVVHQDNISKLEMFFIFIGRLIENKIGLMHNHFTHSKFTTELRLREIFNYLCHLRVVFMAEKYFFHLCCFRNLAKINFQFAFSKRGVVAKFACLMSSCMGIIC